MLAKVGFEPIAEALGLCAELIRLLFRQVDSVLGKARNLCVTDVFSTHRLFSIAN
jgi:hypothetical protein